MNIRLSKKLSVTLLVLGTWSLKYLGVDHVLADLAASPAAIDTAVQISEHAAAAKKMVQDVRAANVTELPALIGAAYIIIQGWIDGKTTRTKQGG